VGGGAVKLLIENAIYTADVIGYTDDVGWTGSNAELNRFWFIGLGEDRPRGNGPATGPRTDTFGSACSVRRSDERRLVLRQATALGSQITSHRQGQRARCSGSDHFDFKDVGRVVNPREEP
jgi:hypothetical protein